MVVEILSFCFEKNKDGREGVKVRSASEGTDVIMSTTLVSRSPCVGRESVGASRKILTSLGLHTFGIKINNAVIFTCPVLNFSPSYAKCAVFMTV